jgi:hypothetical protein
VRKGCLENKFLPQGSQFAGASLATASLQK